MGVAYAVFVLDLEDARLEFFLHQLAFIGPGPGQVGRPNVAAADRQAGRVETAQQDGFLFLPVGDFSPGLDHVDILEGLVKDLDGEGVYLVFQDDRRQGRVAGGVDAVRCFMDVPDSPAFDGQVEGHVSARVGDG